MPAATAKKASVAAKPKPAAKPGSKVAAHSGEKSGEAASARLQASGKLAATQAKKPRDGQPDSPATDDSEMVTRFKDLVDRVAKSLEKKSNQVREVVEATLAELGKALDKGEALHVLPLGKVKVHRSRPAGTGTAIMLKLRRNGPAKDGEKTEKDAIADNEQAG
jgi:nucleoid DNA-binding protein